MGEGWGMELGSALGMEEERSVRGGDCGRAGVMYEAWEGLEG